MQLIITIRASPSASLIGANMELTMRLPAGVNWSRSQDHGHRESGSRNRLPPSAAGYNLFVIQISKCYLDWKRNEYSLNEASQVAEKEIQLQLAFVWVFIFCFIFLKVILKAEQTLCGEPLIIDFICSHKTNNLFSISCLRIDAHIFDLFILYFLFRQILIMKYY